MAALLERIVRPHLPTDSSVQKTAAKCREDEPTKVVKFQAPQDAGAEIKTQDDPKKAQPKKPTEKTRNSSWSYAYKKYMTKKEKEEEKCQPDRVVGGGETDDIEAPESEGTKPTGAGGAPPSGGASGSG